MSQKNIKYINEELPFVNIEQGEIVFKFSEKDEKDYTFDGFDNLDVLFRTNKSANFNLIKKLLLEVNCQGYY